ncbi:MAG: hypothetical protein M3Q34_00705 [bacterium]|nr:hypothetical protein [bacterium]
MRIFLRLFLLLLFAGGLSAIQLTAAPVSVWDQSQHQTIAAPANATWAATIATPADCTATYLDLYLTAADPALAWVTGAQTNNSSTFSAATTQEQAACLRTDDSANYDVFGYNNDSGDPSLTAGPSPHENSCTAKFAYLIFRPVLRATFNCYPI